MGTFAVLGSIALLFIGASVFGLWLTHEEDANADGGSVGSGGFYNADDSDFPDHL